MTSLLPELTPIGLLTNMLRGLVVVGALWALTKIFPERQVE